MLRPLFSTSSGSGACGHRRDPYLERCRPAQRNAVVSKSLFKDALNPLWKLAKGSEEATLAELNPESTGGIGGTSDDVFGPLAVLLVGFTESDFTEFQAMMMEMEADMVQLTCCNSVMMAGTLKDALERGEPGWQDGKLGTRRAIIVSGMYTAEVMEVIDAYSEAGLPTAVFAAAVPKNYQRIVSNLVDEIYSDDAAAKQQRSM